MNRFKASLIIVACVIILGQLILVDFSDLSWSNNSGGYLSMTSMVCLIVAMMLSEKTVAKKDT
ncbi:MAG: hypothetical protein LAT68_14600 [Cyclobacteriaceae bacterium]|nr:hypothetical protein [Cyclobacteriaceae bacterium]MCH8517550.1 hypothetical protein [Cyclobacteriaceae bacterium]